MAQINKQEPCCSSIPELEACCSRAEALLEPEFFRALGDPSRIGVLMRLAELAGASTVSEISACCPQDLSVVSRHLKVLRRAGIVESERRGKEVRYRLLYHRLAGTLREMADAIDACCPPPPDADTDRA